MDLGERSGNRAVGIGEVPYFDPQSKSRNEALGKVKPAPSNGASANGHGHAMGPMGAKGGCPKMAAMAANGASAGANGHGMTH